MGYLLMIGFLVFGVYAIVVAESNKGTDCKCEHCGKCTHEKND